MAQVALAVFIILIMLSAAMVIFSPVVGIPRMSVYYQDADVTCYKDYASGSTSCVKN